ncbi:MAG: helix-turn-helix domain-containing protein [Clostridiales Family XIII bacterium]|jgi:hypothetical protein|nr:helix-turn-helix domain-containing protein [Clostridiales Family XIII bacterium]
MKINFDTLMDGLNGCLDTEVLGSASLAAPLGKVKSLRMGEPPHEGCVWLADNDARRVAEALSDGSDENESGVHAAGGTKTHAVAVANDHEAAKLLLVSFETVVLVRGRAPYAKIRDAVEGVFERYDDWNEGLLRILGENANVQALIDESTPIFGNPLLLHDNNYTAVAASSEYRDDVRLIPFLDSGKLPFIMKNDKSRDAEDGPSGDVQRLLMGESPAIGVKLYKRGKLAYRLIAIEASKEMKQGDAALLNHLSGYVRICLGLVRDDDVGVFGISDIMAGAISGDTTNREYITQQLSGFGWSEDDEFVLYRIYPEIRERNGGNLKFFVNRIIELFDNKCVFEYDEGIVAVFNMRRCPGGEAWLDSTMLGFLRDNFLRAGRSELFSGFSKFAMCCVQAEISHEIGPKVNKYKQLHMFGEVIRQHLLDVCTSRLPASMVCAPGLQRLREFDEKHGTDFYNTVVVYLKNDFQQLKSAKELYVSRSTFLYRLNRVEKITGIDFRDIDDPWHYLLSIELLREGRGGD